MPMSESILRYSVSQLNKQRGSSAFSLLQAHLAGLGVSLALALGWTALLYLPMVSMPSLIGKLLTPASYESFAVLPVCIGILLGGWSLLTWQGIISATFTRREYRPDQPGLSRLPVFRIMLMSLGASLLLALPALALKLLSSDQAMVGVLMLVGLILLTLPLFGVMVMLKSAALALGQEQALSGGVAFTVLNQRAIVGRLYSLNLLLLLLCGGAGLLEVWAQTDPALAGLAPVFGLISFLIWLGISLLTGLAAVRTYQLMRPDAQAAPLTGRPYALGLAALAGTSLLILGGLYASQRSELNKLEQDWQPLLKTRQARVALTRPVLRGQPLPGNGVPAYLSIIGKDDKQSRYTLPEADANQINTYLTALYAHKPTGTLLWLPAVKARHQQAISSLKTAMQHEHFDFAPSFKVDEVLPNYITAQNLAKLMALSAVTDCQQGKCQQGLQSFTDTLRLGQDIGGQGWLISSMVGNVIENLAIQIFGGHFEPDWLTPAQYKQVLSELNNLNQHHQELSYALNNESGLMMQLALDTAKSGGEAMLAMGIDVPGQQQTVGLGEWAGYALMLPQFLDAYRISKEDLVFWESVKGQNYLEIKSRIKAAEATRRARIEQNLLTSIAAANVDGAVDRLAANEAKRLGFYQYLALQAYRAQHGRYPERLEQLVPELIPELPKDPFSNQTFVYKPLGAKDFRLYSLGENTQDDGGKGVFTHTVCTQPDIVFAPVKPKAHCVY